MPGAPSRKAHQSCSTATGSRPTGATACGSRRVWSIGPSGRVGSSDRRAAQTSPAALTMLLRRFESGSPAGFHYDADVVEPKRTRVSSAAKLPANRMGFVKLAAIAIGLK
jgi:hypothetical protein